ncbi:MAG: hypothetical protein LQ338_000873 [Usnochroma carphineum]|nr:MAG: hypothetical protein LQ338_000873 [Usnochroma carphineum]
MGISRLASHLQAYSTTSILGYRGIDSSNDGIDTLEIFIIDGPGLAYHIYHRLLAHRSTVLKGLDAISSYTEIGQAFIAYLDLLETHQCHISHIFFDGFLPNHKRPIRQARLQSSLKDLVKTHDFYPNGFPISRNASASALPPTQLFASPPLLPASFRNIPAPPFLVPAILDALAKSKYGPLTTIVPREADSYCALAARCLGGTILTNDSDLLVYDIGPQASVIFFNSLSLSPADESVETTPVLKANVFNPAAIAKRLSLQNLQRLAYEVKSDPTLSFPEALRRAKASPTNPSLFDFFMQEYVLPSALHIPHQPDSQQSRFLDPRLSELVIQLSSPHQKSEEIHMYLPFLIEDPSRSSAWDVSSSIRHYVYTLLASHHLPLGGTIAEISRRGGSIVPTTIMPYPADEPEPWFALLEETRGLDLDPGLRYRIFALAYIYTWHIDNNKSPPSRPLILREMTGAGEGQSVMRRRREDLHLEAQVQSVLYALRMLKQALGYLKYDVGDDGRRTVSIGGDVVGLDDMLEDLPELGELLPSREEVQQLWADVGIDVTGTLGFIMQGYASEEDGDHDLCADAGQKAQAMDENTEPDTGWQTPKKRKRGKRTTTDSRNQQQQPPKAGKNLYELLAT